MGQLKDQTVRAITKDGALRVITLGATETVQGVLEAQKASGAPAQLLGELVSSAVLVRELMSPGMRVQIILATNPPRFSLIADAQPEGLTRGLLNLPEDGSAVKLGAGTLLQVVRVLYNNELHQGIVNTDADKGVAGSLVTYMRDSEQITTLIDLHVAFGEDGRVEEAGGYAVQVLPEADEAAIALILAHVESLGDFGALWTQVGSDPEALAKLLLRPFAHTILDRSSVHFGCVCSQARVIGALSTMGRAEISDIVRRGEVININCDYCGTEYNIGAENLRPLLENQ